MKYNDYFDYDGNIPSSYISTGFLTADGENAASGEKLEYVSSAVSTPAFVPPVIDIAESQPTSEEPAVSADELAAAISAFENMNTSTEEVHKQLDEMRQRGELEPPKRRERKPAPVEETPEADEKEEPAEPVSERIRTTLERGVSSIKRLTAEKEEKEVSKLKHFFIILLMFILVIVVFTGVVSVFMSSISKENDRASEFSRNAAKVCSDYGMRYGNANYENLYDTYKIQGFRLTGLCFARELDFNDDGESELMIVYAKNGKYYNEVWGKGEKKEFTVLYSEITAQSDDKSKDAYSLLYHSKNKYYIAKFDDKKSLDKFSLMQLRHDGFTKRYRGEYDAKTKAYSVDGKDDTDAFERIRYSVLKEEKASVEVDRVAALIESFKGVDNIEKIEQKQTMNSAYYQIVQDYNKKYGVCEYVEKDSEAYINGLAMVELIDFDGDKNKELLLVYRKPVKVRNETASGENVTYEVDRYYCDIYRYSGGRAILTYTNEGLSNKMNNRSDTYYLIKRENKKAYYCLNSFTVGDYGKHISGVSAQYEFEGTEFKSTFKASFNTDYGYSKYYLDGKSVDKYEFNEKGYINPFFDESEDYDKDKYKVVYVQRKKKDSAELKNIPKKTEKNIQKLNQLYSADVKQ